ncbi:hypothetical protein J6TS2_43640 [Heyndrickxia sporothermodurans]|nr:hypothetical protein J6TS2_43640 [Heyndrickxia sporothermodurans]
MPTEYISLLQLIVYYYRGNAYFIVDNTILSLISYFKGSYFFFIDDIFFNYGDKINNVVDKVLIFGDI